MRRILRTLWLAAMLTSLVLCVTTCTLWVRSHWRSDAFEYATPSSRHDGEWDGSAWAVTIRSRLERVAIVVQRGFVVQFKKGDYAGDFYRVPGWRRSSRVNVPVPRFLTTASPDDPYTDHPRRSYHGFGIDRIDERDRDLMWWGFVVVPHWAIAAVTAVLPALFAARIGRRSRRRSMSV